MPERRFPRPDADFSAYMNHYYPAVELWWNAQGLDPAELAGLKHAMETWNASFPAHVAARSAAEGARQQKDAARRALEAEARPITNFVQSWATTTDADRAAIGITVRADTARRAVPPTSRPQARVESGQRLTHTLRLTDESTPTRKARPAGVLGAEVWIKLVDAGDRDSGFGSRESGAEPKAAAADARSLGDPETFAYLTLATRPSVTAEFRPGDGGKTAVYMLRWINTRGQTGPWSEVATATVAA